MKNNRTTLIKAKNISLTVALLSVIITLVFAPTSAHRNATDTSDPLNWIFWIAAFGWITSCTVYGFLNKRNTTGARTLSTHDSDCVIEHCNGECLVRPAVVIGPTTEEGSVTEVQY